MLRKWNRLIFLLIFLAIGAFFGLSIFGTTKARSIEPISNSLNNPSLKENVQHVSIIEPLKTKISMEKFAEKQILDVEILGKSVKNEFAYVFYITNEVYACYALSNAKRMIDKLGVNSSVDFVLVTMVGTNLEKFCLRKCFGNQLKVKFVPKPPHLTENKRYQNCYVRFEAFKLYQYKRIIIIDADGVVVQKMDHLFLENLGKHRVAMGFTPNLEKWLDSIVIVAEPSPELYGMVSPYLTKEGIKKVGAFNRDGHHYDMDLLNLGNIKMTLALFLEISPNPQK